MKTQIRFSVMVSIMALVAALSGVGGAIAGQFIITSKQIRNGTILSQDIHKGGVKSSDVANGSVGSADITDGNVTGTDIGADQVTPSDVSMPAPTAATPPAASGPVTTAGFSKIADVTTYGKVQAESVLEVSWAGAIASGPSTNCVFQLRVNDAEPNGGGGEVFSQGEAVNISTLGIFNGLPAGPVTVSIWAKASASIGGNPSCIVGPAHPGIDTTIVVTEQVV
jgi:hypothetical protein